ncbi:MAG: rhodanese-like domain-containing protein [Betaproteobacteria bacterium HGW-Betaproteobacteria-22]|nr:MAG: rhodanese-like domain-containing protein [Betaproteobacteria bacterium HGW-Betaproteobacteria-22]
MEFIQNNALLIGLALGSGLMLILPSFKGGAGNASQLSANEAVALINRQHALVIDVRDETEFAGGHIVDAKHIPLAELPQRLAEIKKFQNKPLLLVCQTGARTAKACNILLKAEFKQVSSLRGGLNAWLEAKLPTVKA